MKVKSIKIQDIKAIDTMEVHMEWASIIVTGANNQGKTTLLRSLYNRITGGEKATVRNGKSKWEAVRELTDGSTFERGLSSDWKEKLSYTSPSGEKFKSNIIKGIGKEIFWDTLFDIDWFLRESPNKQGEILKQLLWINTTELDNEQEKVYEERKEIWQQLKQYDWIVGKEKEIEIVDIGSEVEKEQKYKQELFDFEKKCTEYQRVLEEIDRNWILISDLESKLELAKLEKVKLEEKAKTYNSIEEPQKVETNLAELLEHNKKAEAIIENNKKYQIKIDLKKAYESKTQRIEEIKKEKIDMISASKMPEWFTISDWLLEYQWFPLSHSTLSSSALYIASLKLSALTMWELKTQFFDASYLDKESLNKTIQRANENWIQLMMAWPDREWKHQWITYELISDTDNSSNVQSNAPSSAPSSAQSDINKDSLEDLF